MNIDSFCVTCSTLCPAFLTATSMESALSGLSTNIFSTVPGGSLEIVSKALTCV